MRWRVLAAVLFSSCTITITPIKEQTTHKKPKVTRSRHELVRNNAHPAPQPNRDRHIVDADWMLNYKRMEADVNYTIKDDANIKCLPDGTFRVPQHVIDHYQDLLLTRQPDS